DAGTLAGTWVNGERVAEFGPLDERDEIVIAGYRLTIQPRSIGRRASAEPVADAPQPSTEADAASDAAERQGWLTAAREDIANLAAVELEWRRLFHRRLLQAIDLHRKDVRQLSGGQLRSEARALLVALVDAE